MVRESRTSVCKVPIGDIRSPSPLPNSISKSYSSLDTDAVDDFARVSVPNPRSDVFRINRSVKFGVAVEESRKGVIEVYDEL